MSKIKIIWEDAIFYTTHDKIPSSVSTMETTGELDIEDLDYVIVKNPITINKGTGISHPKTETNPKFYFIPKKIIVEKIEI